MTYSGNPISIRDRAKISRALHRAYPGDRYIGVIRVETISGDGNKSGQPSITIYIFDLHSVDYVFRVLPQVGITKYRMRPLIQYRADSEAGGGWILFSDLRVIVRRLLDDNVPDWYKFQSDERKDVTIDVMDGGAHHIGSYSYPLALDTLRPEGVEGEKQGTVPRL